MAQSGGEPIVSSSDEVSLYFKTRQATGMLFYTGKQKTNKIKSNIDRL
jgi:leucine-rich repeat transmembrane neuronal protein 1/2